MSELAKKVIHNLMIYSQNCSLQSIVNPKGYEKFSESCL